MCSCEKSVSPCSARAAVMSLRCTMRRNACVTSISNKWGAWRLAEGSNMRSIRRPARPVCSSVSRRAEASMTINDCRAPRGQSPWGASCPYRGLAAASVRPFPQRWGVQQSCEPPGSDSPIMAGRTLQHALLAVGANRPVRGAIESFSTCREHSCMCCTCQAPMNRRGACLVAHSAEIELRRSRQARPAGQEVP